jgi:peroxiredoxin Q/BCP
LTSLVNDYDKFKSEGTEIVAISVDPPEKGRDLAEKLKIQFPLLSDADHKVIDAYGVFDAEGKISKTAVFLVDKKGVVRWSYIGENKTDRPLNETMLEELKKLN